MRRLFESARNRILLSSLHSLFERLHILSTSNSISSSSSTYHCRGPLFRRSALTSGTPGWTKTTRTAVQTESAVCVCVCVFARQTAPLYAPPNGQSGDRHSEHGANRRQKVGGSNPLCQSPATCIAAAQKVEGGGGGGGVRL